MMYSIIIPVYNRPDEVDELLCSLSHQSYSLPFEVLIIEDGSTLTCKNIVDKYLTQLQISYYYKTNSGPGDSRNFGMNKAKGDYFIIFDSDCVIPPSYLEEVDRCLKSHFVDCFGGRDAAQEGFTIIQKAINFSMTSVLTTGGIRGKKSVNFQPRSFNMGLSKNAFEQTGGFGKIHPGEDPELVFRLWKLGFKTTFFEKAFVYHKRRIDIHKFYTQVNKFGKVRPIIESWHPEFQKITFLFPTLFIMGFVIAIVSTLFGFKYLFYAYFMYFILLVVSAFYMTKNVKLAVLSCFMALVQLYSYGLGYAKSFFWIRFMGKKPEKKYPNLFF